MREQYRGASLEGLSGGISCPSHPWHEALKQETQSAPAVGFLVCAQSQALAGPPSPERKELGLYLAQRTRASTGTAVLVLESRASALSLTCLLPTGGPCTEQVGAEEHLPQCS